MSDLPTVVTAAGLQPIAPVDLRRMLVTLVAATNPGYTSDLPGTLIEDIASTDVGALLLADQARIELINSLTPAGANEFLLLQLGAIYGVPKGGASNTSVQVVFTASDPGAYGWVISRGFVVSDGQFQYVVQDGGVISAVTGTSGNLTAVANQTGSWAVPSNTVNQFVTPAPTGVNVTVSNPLAGTPGGTPQTWEEYRTQVLRAGLAATQGMSRYLKTLLRNVAGVQERLISVRQQQPNAFGCGSWEIIVGGNGDNYQVANAIFNAIFDVSALVGSSIQVTGITNASPGVVTTDINHLLTTGQVIQIAGIVGMVSLNNVPLTVTVTGPKSFSVGVNTTSLPMWISGGVVTPNSRNVQVYIDDYPDKYLIPFVVPPLQNVDIVVTWNTSATNFVGAASVASLAAPALIQYINSIPAGQPILLYSLESTFRNAVSGILSPEFITRMVFAVSIDGLGVSAEGGTGIIPGDPESYLFASASSIQINQG